MKDPRAPANSGPGPTCPVLPCPRPPGAAGRPGEPVSRESPGAPQRQRAFRKFPGVGWPQVGTYCMPGGGAGFALIPLTLQGRANHARVRAPGKETPRPRTRTSPAEKGPGRSLAGVCLFLKGEHAQGVSARKHPKHPQESSTEATWGGGRRAGDPVPPSPCLCRWSIAGAGFSSLPVAARHRGHVADFSGSRVSSRACDQGL